MFFKKKSEPKKEEEPKKEGRYSGIIPKVYCDCKKWHGSHFEGRVEVCDKCGEEIMGYAA